jgi:hypothetical protein
MENLKEKMENFYISGGQIYLKNSTLFFSFTNHACLMEGTGEME